MAAWARGVQSPVRVSTASHLARKPGMLVAVALADRMAWAAAAKKELDRVPARAPDEAAQAGMAPEARASRRNGQGQTVIETGSENRFLSSRLRARGNDLDPIRVPPDRPAANATASRRQPEAGHMTALDRAAQTGPKKLFAPTGASTHEETSA